MTKTINKPRSLRGTIIPPGDKSISHRAAIFNAISNGTATITNYSTGKDCASTVTVLRALGVHVERVDNPNALNSTLTIKGNGPNGLTEPEDILDAGNSGTTMRMMAGLLAGQSFMSVITGDDSLRNRPMGRIVAPLTRMGSEIHARGQNTRAPLVFTGGELQGIKYEMPVPSGQLKSCLSLAGLRAKQPSTIVQPAISRDHTERMLIAMGADLSIDELTFTIRPGTLNATDVDVPGDISSAAFWLVAAVCHPDAEIHLPGVGVNPTRIGALTVLKKMGADISLYNLRESAGEPIADIVARSSSLQGTEIGGDIVPLLLDEIPVLAVAAAMATGTTEITNAAELRVKESDRIEATANWLTKAGVGCEEIDDGGLAIHGTGSISGGAFDSHGDHRIAMALGTVGMVADSPVSINDSEVAAISYPTFWSDLSQIVNENGN